MTETQKRLAALQVEQSEKRERANALLGKDDRTDAETAELDVATKRLQAIEPELRAALVLASDDGEGDIKPNGGDKLDAETRERLALRAKCSVTKFVEAALRGRLVTGPEAEFQAACGVTEGVPLELLSEPETRENVEKRVDTSTDAPGTTGINLAPIRPAVFSMSIAPRLGIEMPRVKSGSYAEARIETSLSAEAKAKGGAAEASAATFAVSTVTPKRISGRLGIRIEDIASVGQANFESALRNNLTLVMSDALDTQMLTGDGMNDDLTGIFQRLTDPGAPTAVATFDEFIAKYADAVDGLWAGAVKDVAIVCGPATYALSAKTFQSAANYKGELSAASYLAKETAGWWTNKRMPDAAADVQQGVVHRRGRAGLRTAVCPHWGALSIDDVYTGSASGTRFLSMHVLVGDVILVQPGAYAQVSYQLA